MAGPAALYNPPILAELAAQGPLALFLDFDGTLVEIAATPGAIVVPGDFALRLETLSEAMSGRVAVVSGRSLVDLADHIGPMRVARAGSHGLERIRADHSRLGEEPRPIAPEIEQALHEFADSQAGMVLERKAHGAALHFRAAPGLQDVAHAFADRLAARFDLATKRGKCVVELVHPGADKAGAVTAFMQDSAFCGARPVFIGDDVTDEDGFRAARDLGGFGIIVGERRPTLAQYCLSSPEKVHEWLCL